MSTNFCALMKSLLPISLLFTTILCSFYDFRSSNSTFLHDLGVIDAYLFPVSGVPEEVLRASAKSSTHSDADLLTALATSILDAALYFRTHPTLLTSLTLGVVQSGRIKMQAAQLAAYRQAIQLVGAHSHLGQLLSDYSKMMTGKATFSAYIKDALVLELERELRLPSFDRKYGKQIRKIELEYERRMMDVMLEGTAGKRELQTPFLMMAAGMKLVHDKVGFRDRIPATSPGGTQINATNPHNLVEAKLLLTPH